MLIPSRIASRAAGACALALSLLLPVHAAPVLEMSVAPSAAGAELTVSARDFVDLYAYQFTLNFDPTLLTALAGTEGSFLPSGGPTFFHPGDIDNVAGTVTFVLATLLGPGEGVDGSGDLATFSFGVELGGYASFSLSEVIFLDSAGAEITVDISDLVAQVPEPATSWLVVIALVVALFAVRGGRTMRPRTP
jgi:hypothetical protein